jgi:hypothetical protein
VWPSRPTVRLIFPKPQTVFSSTYVSICTDFFLVTRGILMARVVGGIWGACAMAELAKISVMLCDGLVEYESGTSSSDDWILLFWCFSKHMNFDC